MSVDNVVTNANQQRDIPYTHEVRFGIVMYGGVSLAIYINGVANELYELASATSQNGDTNVKQGTREVYRKLSWLVNNPELCQEYLGHLRGETKTAVDFFQEKMKSDNLQRTRFIVDVISGTSAGGINGIFLAKALANGQDFSPLRNLWVREGDIDELLNDKQSYRGIEFAKNDEPPRSLLNSDRMYLKLFEAMQKMEENTPAPGVGTSKLVEELDLFVTTTDIRGAVVPIRLFDKVVYEKRYRQVFHFQYAAANGQVLRNDLVNANTPFLAFAARCTASFPFAFEPMQVTDADQLCFANPKSGKVDFGEWKSFFTGLSNDDMEKDKWRDRAFGDGGYLDNKPFSYVVDALSWRLGRLPIERKLIYVEPAPSHPERERQVYPGKPDAIENALAALTSIPQYETIREDLETVLRRNRRIERVERIVRKVEEDIEGQDGDPFKKIKLDNGKVPKWEDLDMREMVDYYGVAYLPYRRLRLNSVTDDIAERIADRWGVDRRSDRFYALRALVRVWREQRYFDYRNAKTETQKESVNAYLNDFDVKYRLRRVAFVLRKMHQMSRVVRWMELAQKNPPPLTDIEDSVLRRIEKRQPALKAMEPKEIQAALDDLRKGFGQAMGELRETTWLKMPVGVAASDLAWRKTLDQVLGVIVGEKSANELATLAAVDGAAVQLPWIDLPEFNPRLTLQENVFARAKTLLEFAQKGPRTQLQDFLERDIARLRNEYAKVIRPNNGGKTSLTRNILGNPQFVAGSAEKPADENNIEAKTTNSTDKVIQPPQTAVMTIEKLVDLQFGSALNREAGVLVRRFLSEYYLRFDEYDQMSFPLYYETGTGEPSTVEVIRISPEDATSLINETDDQGKTNQPRRKLAGTAVFNFGGFLNAEWRRNDIMWGRLDGCERLLTALLPGSANHEIRDTLLGEAQRAILKEEMHPEKYKLLVDNFARVLAEQPEGTLNEAFLKLWEHLGPAQDAQRRTQIAQTLKSILGEDGMVDYVKQYYEVNRDLDTEKTLKTGARAVTITGKILEESEKNYRATSSRMVWLTRTGRVLQVLLGVSTPGTLRQSLFRHWLALLYVFEVLIVGGSILFSSTAARTFGLTAIAITGVAHLATLVTGDLLAKKHWWVKLLATAVVLAALIFVLLGIRVVLNGNVASESLVVGAR